MAGISNSTKSILRVIQIILQVIFNILFYIVVILFAIYLSRNVYDFSYQIFGNVPVEEAPGQTVSFEIKKGEDIFNISKKLKRDNLIVNPYSFTARVKISVGKRQPIVPGIYELNSSMTYDKIIAIITNTESKAENGVIP